MKETIHYRRKRLGKCVRCGRARLPNSTMCELHIDDLKNRRLQKIKDGLCTYCSNTAKPEKTICEDCSRKRQEQSVAKKREGLCVSQGCKNTAVLGKVSCEKCSSKRSDKLRELKQLVLSYYGQKCNCPCGCKVTKFEHLTIDHKNDDGAKQRRESGSHGGHANYRRIIKAGFPDDLQVLCFNCNCAKEFYGGCE